MTMADALQQLDALPYHWTIGKGRVRKNEPLWAVEVFSIRGDGNSDTAASACVIEGDSLDYCVNRVVAWHQQQS